MFYILFYKYAVRHFNLIQITEWMQIRQNVTPIRIKYNILPRPLRPDTIMNKYKRPQYPELAYLILSTRYFTDPSHEINWQAMRSERDGSIFRVQKLSFINIY